MARDTPSDCGSENSDETGTMNRRDVLKATTASALGTVGAAMASGSAAASSGPVDDGLIVPAYATSQAGRNRLSDEAVQRAVVRALRADDVGNLMDPEWAHRAGRAGLVGRGQSSPGTDLADSAYVDAARHDLGDGTGMTATAFVSEDRALFYYEYDDPVDGIETKAVAWDVVGDDPQNAKLSLRGTSVNGRTKRDAATVANGECGTCNAPSDYRDGGEECEDLDVWCALSRCSVCSWCNANVVCLIGCLGLYCPVALASCCTEWKSTCRSCFA